MMWEQQEREVALWFNEYDGITPDMMRVSNRMTQGRTGTVERFDVRSLNYMAECKARRDLIGSKIFELYIEQHLISLRENREIVNIIFPAKEQELFLYNGVEVGTPPFYMITPHFHQQLLEHEHDASTQFPLFETKKQRLKIVPKWVFLAWIQLNQVVLDNNRLNSRRFPCLVLGIVDHTLYKRKIGRTSYKNIHILTADRFSQLVEDSIYELEK